MKQRASIMVLFGTMVIYVFGIGVMLPVIPLLVKELSGGAVGKAATLYGAAAVALRADAVPLRPGLRRAVGSLRPPADHADLAGRPRPRLHPAGGGAEPLGGGAGAHHRRHHGGVGGDRHRLHRRHHAAGEAGGEFRADRRRLRRRLHRRPAGRRRARRVRLARAVLRGGRRQRRSPSSSPSSCCRNRSITPIGVPSA